MPQTVGWSARSGARVTVLRGQDTQLINQLIQFPPLLSDQLPPELGTAAELQVQHRGGLEGGEAEAILEQLACVIGVACPAKQFPQDARLTQRHVKRVNNVKLFLRITELNINRLFVVGLHSASLPPLGGVGSVHPHMPATVAVFR